MRTSAVVSKWKDWVTSTAVLAGFVCPFVAQAGALFGLETRAGIMSPNQTNGDEGSDPTSYRFSSGGLRVGYASTYFSLFLNGGQSRYNNEGTIVPFKSYKLSDMYAGGGISIGTLENLQLHGYGSAVWIKNSSALSIANEVIVPNGSIRGKRAGAVLTGNQFYVTKSRASSNRQYQMGLGVEGTMLESQPLMPTAKRNFLSFFLAIGISYHSKGESKLPFGL